MKHTKFLLVSYLVCNAQALQFGERKSILMRRLAVDSVTHFIDKFLVSPDETQITKHSVTCYDKIQQLTDNSTASWLTFYLKVALHITQLYNVGLYQNVSIGRICLHGTSKLARVSFPESPMILHDQGTVTVPQTAPTTSNHHILHPFEDFVAFARPDRPNPIPSLRYSITRDVVEAILDPSSVKYFDSFDKAQEHVLVPLHPIYMVRDIYLALLESNAIIETTLMNSIENQIQLSNPSLPSSIPWPLPLPQLPKYEKILATFPKAVYRHQPNTMFPLDFSWDHLPVIDVTSPYTSYLAEAASLPSTSGQSSTESSFESVHALSPTASSQEKKLEPSRPNVKMAPLFHIKHNSAHQGSKKMNFGLNKQAFPLRKQKNTKAYHCSKKETEYRMKAKRMIDVTFAKNYFLQHPFFSSYIYNKDPKGRSFFSIHHFIKTRCREYEDINAPMITVVCKKELPMSNDLNIYWEYLNEFRPFLLSWFTTFLSRRPHTLDRHSHAPSILKAQLILLLKASIFHLQNSNGITPPINYSENLQKLLHHSYDNTGPSYIVPNSQKNIDVAALWKSFNEKSQSLTGDNVNESSSSEHSSNYSEKVQQNEEVSALQPKKVRKKELDPQEIDKIRYSLRGFIACGEIFTALLHYFSTLSVPSAHTLPLPKINSMRHGQGQFDFSRRTTVVLPPIPILKEISSLYNSKFLSFNDVYTRYLPSLPLSLACVVIQYKTRECQSLTDSLDNATSSLSSSLFYSTASRLYRDSLSLSQKFQSYTSSIPYQSFHTLSLFHSLSTLLLPFKSLALFSSPPAFAYFLGFSLLHLSSYDTYNTKRALCEKDYKTYSTEYFSVVSDRYNFSIVQEIQPLCATWPDGMNKTLEDTQFYMSSENFIPYLLQFFNTIPSSSRKVFVENIFIRWAVLLHREKNEDTVKSILQQNPVLYFSSFDKRHYLNEFLHDAALLQKSQI